MSHIHLGQMKWIGTYNHVHNVLELLKFKGDRKHEGL
jgi:hypothetical protein